MFDGLRQRLIFGVCLLLASHPGLGRAQDPAGSPAAEGIQGLVNIRFQNDIRVFAVMAALNAAGFDDELPEREMSPTRRQVREAMTRLNPDLLQRLRLFYEERREPGSRAQTPYTSLALLLSGPPDFELQTDESNSPRDAWQVRGFEKLVKEVYEQGRLDALWQQVKPAYEKELNAYQPILRELITETLRYFRVPARVALDREIILIPDLLDVQEIVNARNLERVYYIVVGPSANPSENRTQLRHEYLHFLVDPLVRKYSVRLLEHEKLLDVAQRQPNIQAEYQNKFLLVVTESLIEAIQAQFNGRLEGEPRDRRLVELFRRGLIFAPYFAAGLDDYQSNDLVALPTFAETLFASIKGSRINRDEEWVTSREAEFQAADQNRLATQTKAEEQFRLRKEQYALFDDASRLLSEQQFEAAEERLNELLRLDPDNGNALFYLAQIAAQRQEYAAAHEFYRRSSLSTETADWVRAWSLVRMGKISAAQGRMDEARQMFQQVAGMSGDLRGANEEAERSLELLAKGNP